MIKVFFAITAFLGSFLYFLIQPLVSKFVLPILGGSYSVWVISLSFFQFVLIISYLLVHILFGKKISYIQAIIYSCFILFCSYSYSNDISIAFTLGDVGDNIISWYLKFLMYSVGLPVIALGTSQLSLQRFWQKYSKLDPKFIFAYSNLGSFGGLIFFIGIFEPYFTINQTFSIWYLGTKIWLILMLIIIIFTFSIKQKLNIFEARDSENINLPNAIKDSNEEISLDNYTSSNEKENTEKIHYTNNLNNTSFVKILKDFSNSLGMIFPILLPSISSTMILGATSNVINLDIAVFPLFWVITLGVYLLTWVLAFKEKTISLEAFENYLPEIFIGAIALYFLSTLGYTIYPIIKAIGFIFFLFILCIILHIKLRYELQNYNENITQYYFVITIGGFLGNLVVSIIAPFLFLGFWEYLIAILTSGYSLWNKGIYSGINYTQEIIAQYDKAISKDHNYKYFLRIFGILVATLFVLVFYKHLPSTMSYFIVSTALCIYYYYITFRYFVSIATKQVFVLLLICFCIIITETYGTPGEIKYSKRTQYGIYKVYDQNNIRYLRMGTTIHGCQMIDNNQKPIPIGYHHINSPIGQLLSKKFENKQRIAVIGLGAGVMAGYANQNMLIDFYELDSECIKIAYKWFNYLQKSEKFIKVTCGDGRIMLRNSVYKYNIIVMDAFSSDAIPVHLITLEAIKEYLNKLYDDGIIVLHISNRFFDLEPLIISLCKNLELSYSVSKLYDDDLSSHIYYSKWIAIGKKEAMLKYFNDQNYSLWENVKSDYVDLDSHKIRPWSDDYSSILAIIQ